MDWLDDLREGVVLVEDRHVDYVNRAAAALLHVDAERARGRPLISVVRDHRIERVWLEGEAVELEARARRLVVRPIAGGLAIEDVTALRAREEEARDLLAVLSHELRTPVTTIQSTLEALDAGVPEAQRKRFLARALQEGERLVRLLEDLTVDVAPPRARRVWLPDVVERAATLLGPLLEARSVGVRRAGPELAVWMDPDKVLQVVLNLLENAALHGPSSSEIEVATATSEDGRYAVVEVRDRGAPLDPGAFDALFSPHRRGVGPVAGGSGLGLYIVRSIAEKAGGRAWGMARPDGNTFAVSLPRPGERQEGASTGSVRSI